MENSAMENFVLVFCIIIPSLIIIYSIFIAPIRWEQKEKKLKEEQEKRIKEITKKVNNETLKNYTVEKLISNNLPNNGFCAELKETILNGLKEKKYKSIAGEYYWINTIAEYENFTSEKTRRILNELFAANKIELVYLHTNDNKRLLCCKLK